MFDRACPSPSPLYSSPLCELDIDSSTIGSFFEGLPDILEDHSSLDADTVAEAVTVASLPVFPSTPPARGSWPSSMLAQEGEFPLVPSVTTVVADRKTRRKGRGAAGCESQVPAVAHIVPKILPLNLKGSEHVRVGFSPQVRCFRAPKRCRTAKTAGPSSSSRTQRTRFYDKVEHIVRERWRRDDMAGKFLVLESLLPPSSKRDRFTIVEDSMKLVKNLQHRKEEALKRRLALEQAVACATQSSGMKLSQIIHSIGSLAVMAPPGVEQPTSGLPSSSSEPRCLPKTKTTTDEEACVPSFVVPKFLRDCVQRFCLHSELPSGDIVLEMSCEKVPNFHSGLMMSMDALGLDVVRCCVTQAVSKVIYNITVKPFPSTCSVSSSASIVEGLSMAFQKE